jgi:hypothetical protein
MSTAELRISTVPSIETTALGSIRLLETTSVRRLLKLSTESNIFNSTDVDMNFQTPG